MTDRIDTAALRALLDKATEKATPWEVCDGPVGYQHRIYTTTPETTMAVVCDVVRSGNAALIAAAINALPELLRVYQAVADAPEETFDHLGGGTLVAELVLPEVWAAVDGQRVRLVPSSGEGCDG